MDTNVINNFGSISQLEGILCSKDKFVVLKAPPSAISHNDLMYIHKWFADHHIDGIILLGSKVEDLSLDELTFEEVAELEMTIKSYMQKHEKKRGRN